MLYICIPVHDEAPTIGVLLWRIRGALQELTREYEIVVYDDGSTDVTPEVLEPYERVVPLTVLRGARRQGYAHAVDQLARHVAERTPYPRRDAMVIMQGDFTDRPEDIPDLLKRFEGGADVVVTERQFAESDPTPARRFGRVARWALRPFVKLDGVAELTSTYRLIRIAAVRDLLRERGDRPLLSASDTASANAELLMALRPHVRRVESIAVTPRYDARVRLSRIRPLADAWTLARFAWGARGGKLPNGPIATRVATTPAPSAPPGTRSPSQAEISEPIGASDAGAKTRGRGGARRDRDERKERRERRPRSERPELTLATDGVDAATEKPSAERSVAENPSTDTTSELTRRRPRSRRKKRGSRSDALANEQTGDSDMLDSVAELSDNESSRDAGSEGLNEQGDTGAVAEIDAGESSDALPPRARRSRRGRKRRRPTESGASDAPMDDPGEAPNERAATERAPRESSSGDRADVANGDESGNGEDSGSGDGPPRARRSRRGRRRGGSRSPADGEASGESSPPHDAPRSEPFGGDDGS